MSDALGIVTDITMSQHNGIREVTSWSQPYRQYQRIPSEDTLVIVITTDETVSEYRLFRLDIADYGNLVDLMSNDILGLQFYGMSSYRQQFRPPGRQYEQRSFWFGGRRVTILLKHDYQIQTALEYFSNDG